MRYSSLSIFIVSVFFLSACHEPESVVPNDNVVEIQGTEYPTIKIGTQTWTALNYSGTGGIPFSGAVAKPEYGRYYTFAELNSITLPDGWRIPTMQDYIDLAEANGIAMADYRPHAEKIKSLTSKTNWKNIPGTNISGFNAHPAGYGFGTASPIDGDIAEFWTIEQKTLSIQENGLLTGLRIAFYDSSNSPDFRFNVRFVKSE